MSNWKTIHVFLIPNLSLQKQESDRPGHLFKSGHGGHRCLVSLESRDCGPWSQGTTPPGAVTEFLLEETVVREGAPAKSK